MGKSTQFAESELKLIFNGTPITNLADSAAVSPATQLYVTLHTADPGADGDQTVNEVSYPGYARVAVPRDDANWTVVGNTVSIVNSAVFPQRTDAGAAVTATHASVGLVASGAGMKMYSGALSVPIVIQQNTKPELEPGAILTES
jgi:hypothetical protein